jgi:NitT/TauT family transport system permease protein
MSAAGLKRAGGSVLPPVLFGVLFLLLWQTFVRVANVRSFVLPAPTDIWSATMDHAARITSAAGHSGLNALVGLLIGVVAGVLLAAIAARLPVLGGAVTPLVAALAAMPIVALAPLLNNMYSPLSPLPRREVVAISAFVPIFINVYRGLSRLSAVHRELMYSYAASQTAVLRTIRIPGAMPYFFTGLRVASSLAVIAAVVSEYFGGLQDGLGSRITASVGASDYPAAWASVFGAVILGLLFYVAALVLERIVLGRRAAPAT